MLDIIITVINSVRAFGRPPSPRAALDADDAVRDERIGALERRQREIAARLRLLEVAGDPRGLRDES